MIERLPRPTVASKTANLFKVAPAGDPPDPHRTPPAFRHQLRKPSVGARTPGALRDFKDIKHPLSGDTLDAIVADLTVQPLQRRAPGIAGGSNGAYSGSLQFVQERHLKFLPSPPTKRRRSIWMASFNELNGVREACTKYRQVIINC
jgi:hypothetical protein